MTTNPRLRPFQPTSRLTSEDAQALNLLARHTARFTLELGRPARRWHGSLVATTETVPASTGDLLVELDWAGTPLTLQIPEGSLKMWMEVHMPELQFSTMSHELLLAALDVWLDQAFHAWKNELPSQAGTAPRVVNATTSPDDRSSSLPFTWTLVLHPDDAPHPVPDSVQDEPATAGTAISVSAGIAPAFRAVLRGDSAALKLLAQFATQLPPGDGPDLHGLNVNVTVLIGHTSLSIASIRSLDRGDVVLLDEYLVDTDGQLWLALGRSAGLRVRCEQGRYTVTQGWTSLMTDSSTDPNNPETPLEDDTLGTHNDDTLTADASTVPEQENTIADDPDATALTPADLGDVNIRLSFDLGHRQLPLTELQTLQPGAIFDLARPLSDGPVHIRANGTLIGYGELVDIDGRIGVQINRLGSGQ